MKTSELCQPTTDQTFIPYRDSALSTRCNDSDETTTQYFYDMSSPSSQPGRKRKHDGFHKKSREKPVFDQGFNIFFFFSCSDIKIIIICLC